MDLEQMKKIISGHKFEHERYMKKCEVADRYFKCKNDILKKPVSSEKVNNPLRNSIHRIPSKFYHTLVIQKASYLFGYPVKFDIGNKKDNELIKDKLGPDWGKNTKQLAINASNHKKAWLHVWIIPAEETESGRDEIEYGIVNGLEIIDVWGNTLDKELLAILRKYNMTDTEGTEWEIYEWWDKEFCYSFRKEVKAKLDLLKEYNRYRFFNTDINDWEETNVYKHGFDEVPFICCKNNNFDMNDLEGIKDKIDAYDEILSGFADDLEDIQQIIFILSGYGAEPPADFLQRVKKNKLVKISANDQDKPSLDTLTIDLPTEARQLALEMLKKLIFEEGAGVDTNEEVYSYTSGESMKYMYALLELKASQLEDEFRNSFSRLIKIICKFYGISYPDQGVKQIWKRNKINNDTELVNNSKNCLGVTSKRTALSINPYVTDVDEELELIKKEEAEEIGEIPNLSLLAQNLPINQRNRQNNINTLDYSKNSNTAKKSSENEKEVQMLAGKIPIVKDKS